jgi:hypothetical protein
VRKPPAYYDSQGAAAAALNIDIYVLREAKAEGCPAFRSGRVYWKELLDWLENRQQSVAEVVKTEPLDNSVTQSGCRNLLSKDVELPKTHWDRKKARVDYERALFRFEIEKKEYVPLDEICGAVGQMLAGFRTAMNMLPGSAARWLIGLKDFHAIKSKLENEVDGVLQCLGRCRYLEDLAPAVIDRVLTQRTEKYREDVQKIVAAIFIELGRECFKELQIDLDEPTNDQKS